MKMKTYDKSTHEPIETPNLEKGYTYPGQRYVGTERVILGGTLARYPPDGLAYDKLVYEECMWYHTYTEDELAAMHPPDEPEPDPAATWDEMATAYRKGVSMA